MTPRSRLRQVPLEDVKIPRKRRPIRDIADLAASIEEVGLLNPITLTSKMRLIAGLHRLEACRAGHLFRRLLTSAIAAWSAADPVLDHVRHLREAAFAHGDRAGGAVLPVVKTSQS